MKVQKLLFIVIFTPLFGVGCVSTPDEAHLLVPQPQHWYPNIQNNSIQCSFSVFQNAVYEDGEEPWNADSLSKKIDYFTSQNTEPVVINFLDLDTDQPRMAGNNGDANLIKLKETSEVLVLAEDNYNGIFTYTFFKNDNIVLWSKPYQLIANPYSHQAFGYCQ